MDIARLVSQIMGGGDPATKPSPAGDDFANPPPDDPADPALPDAAQESVPEWPTEPLRLSDGPVRVAQIGSKIDEGAPNEAASTAGNEQTDSVAPQQRMRRHGSAKPID
jgi:hypothetical protein